MKQKKPRIFICGLVNFNWSLDLNAKTISKFLDKEKFEVATMCSYNNQTLLNGLENTKLIKRKFPDRLSRYWAYLKGLMWCDLAIVYRAGEYEKMHFLFLLFRTNTMRVLGINPVHELGRKSITSIDHIYAISDKNKSYCESVGIRVEKKILLNPIDLSDFLDFSIEPRQHVRNVVFIGSNFVRKNLCELIEVSHDFPYITFNILGGYTPDMELANSNGWNDLQNVYFRGIVNRKQLVEYIREADLHILPSREEGRPKSVFETAAMKVPSVVYNDYGADEYIQHEINGYIVSSVNEIKKVIRQIQDQPEAFLNVSKESINMAEKYHVSYAIKDYESEISRILKANLT